MKQAKIIRQRTCMIIFTLGIALAGLHKMGYSIENPQLIAAPSSQSNHCNS